MLIYQQGHNEVSPVPVPAMFCLGASGWVTCPSPLRLAAPAEASWPAGAGDVRSVLQVPQGRGREGRVSSSSGLQEPFLEVRPPTLGGLTSEHTRRLSRLTVLTHSVTPGTAHLRRPHLSVHVCRGSRSLKTISVSNLPSSKAATAEHKARLPRQGDNARGALSRQSC